MAVDVVVFCSAVVPVVIVLIMVPLFFRAARRNDEREALEKKADNWPTG
jgi:uncharacterized membrane protein YqiK